MKEKTLIFGLLSFFILAGCVNHQNEKEQNWQSLFNGKTFRGWQGLGLDSIPHTQWVIENGTIRNIAKNSDDTTREHPPVRCDLITVDTFLNFELRFEWKISPQGNSGIKYNVSEKMSTQNGSKHALSFEYQIIDDTGYPKKLEPWQQTAALYALVPARGALPKPTGEWNTGRIVLKGNHGEHWINGRKVVEYDLGTPHFNSLVQQSKYHVHPHFAEKRYGHIVLQDHGDNVWFRDLKILRIKQ